MINGKVKQMLSVILLISLLNLSVDAFTCEKVCSEKNHYRKEPAYHAQVSLRTPAALGKTKTANARTMLFKRSSLITEFDLPSIVGADEQQRRTVIVREGLV